MKLEPLPKLDKRNKTTSKKIENDVMSKHCDVIIIFLVYDQFGAIRKPDSGFIVCKTYVFIYNNLLSYKRSHTIALSKGTIFGQKKLIFCKKMLASAKLRRTRY